MAPSRRAFEPGRSASSRKVGRSALSIFVGGIIKLHTLPLLALVGLRKTRVGFIAIGLGVAAVAAVLALDMWLAPREWATFVGESSTLAHLAVSGPENGGAKNLIETLLSTTGGAPDLTIASIVYMLTAGSILVIGAATCLRLASDADGASPDVTLFGILTFVLALPRVMTYEWVIAVPAVCFFAPKVTPTWARRLVLVLVFRAALRAARGHLGPTDDHSGSADLLRELDRLPGRVHRRVSQGPAGPSSRRSRRLG
jgi:hypothetical protein